MRFLLRCVAILVAVAVAVFLVPGVGVVYSGNNLAAFAIMGVIIAILNVSIKPILQLLSAPITFISLGVFYLVINTAMLYLAASIGNSLFSIGFYIDNFASGFIASIVISIVSAIMNGILDND